MTPGAPFQLHPETRNPFIVARDLGKSVEELGQSMSADEYMRWEALYSVEKEEHDRAMKRASGK